MNIWIYNYFSTRQPVLCLDPVPSSAPVRMILMRYAWMACACAVLDLLKWGPAVFEVSIQKVCVLSSKTIIMNIMF